MQDRVGAHSDSCLPEVFLELLLGHAMNRFVRATINSLLAFCLSPFRIKIGQNWNIFGSIVYSRAGKKGWFIRVYWSTKTVSVIQEKTF
jgi:hypothetical protein